MNHPIDSNCMFAKPSNVPSHLSVFQEGVTLVHWKLQILAISSNTIISRLNTEEGELNGTAMVAAQCTTFATTKIY